MFGVSPFGRIIKKLGKIVIQKYCSEFGTPHFSFALQENQIFFSPIGWPVKNSEKES